MKFFQSLIPAFLLTPVASKVYTGFNYGAFWGEPGNARQAADFRDGFNYAKGLTSPVAFDSARLYSCVTAGTKDDPTAAFEAAVDTKTNLLLGMWISGGSVDDIVKNEISALGKGFQTHGQALADLVIGLSVGNEDVFRSQDPGQVGVSAVDVSATIKKVKEAITASEFAAFMKDKPIGHVDTAQWAVVDGADFYGMTAYPYWANDTIENAKNSFTGSLENVKQRAGNTPVWIAEMGWPVEGPQRGDAVASTDNLQKFWTEVGCSTVGMYNTFWFELIKDSTSDQPDWGILDAVTHQSRIKDFSCPGAPQPNPSAVLPASSSPSAVASSSNPTTTSSVTLAGQTPTQVSPTMATSAPSPPSTASDEDTTYISTTVVVTIPPSPSSLSTQPAYQLLSPSTYPSIESGQSTTHVTQTIMVTVPPTAPTTASLPPEEEEETVTTTITSTIYVSSAIQLASTESAVVKVSSLDSQVNPPAEQSAQQPALITSAPIPSMLASDVPWCVTVAEITWDGLFAPVDAGPAGPDGKCSSPPTYTGLPYGSSPPTTSPRMVILEPVPVASSTSSSVVAASSSVTTPTPPSSATPSSASPVSQPPASSQHPFCKRKESKLIERSATKQTLSAQHSTLSTSVKQNTDSLPDFTLATSVPDSRTKRKRMVGSEKRWSWFGW